MFDSDGKRGSVEGQEEGIDNEYFDALDTTGAERAAAEAKRVAAEAERAAGAERAAEVERAAGAERAAAEAKRVAAEAERAAGVERAAAEAKRVAAEAERAAAEEVEEAEEAEEAAENSRKLGKVQEGVKDFAEYTYGKMSNVPYLGRRAAKFTGNWLQTKDLVTNIPRLGKYLLSKVKPDMMLDREWMFTSYDIRKAGICLHSHMKKTPEYDRGRLLLEVGNDVFSQKDLWELYDGDGVNIVNEKFRKLQDHLISMSPKYIDSKYKKCFLSTQESSNGSRLMLIIPIWYSENNPDEFTSEYVSKQLRTFYNSFGIQYSENDISAQLYQIHKQFEEEQRVEKNRSAMETRVDETFQGLDGEKEISKQLTKAYEDRKPDQCQTTSVARDILRDGHTEKTRESLQGRISKMKVEPFADLDVSTEKGLEVARKSIACAYMPLYEYSVLMGEYKRWVALGEPEEGAFSKEKKARLSKVVRELAELSQPLTADRIRKNDPEDPTKKVNKSDEEIVELCKDESFTEQLDNTLQRLDTKNVVTKLDKVLTKFVDSCLVTGRGFGCNDATEMYTLLETYSEWRPHPPFVFKDKQGNTRFCRRDEFDQMLKKEGFVHEMREFLAAVNIASCCVKQKRREGGDKIELGDVPSLALLDVVDVFMELSNFNENELVPGKLLRRYTVLRNFCEAYYGKELDINNKEVRKEIKGCAEFLLQLSSPMMNNERGWNVEVAKVNVARIKAMLQCESGLQYELHEQVLNASFQVLKQMHDPSYEGKDEISKEDRLALVKRTEDKIELEEAQKHRLEEQQQQRRAQSEERGSAALGNSSENPGNMPVTSERDSSRLAAERDGLGRRTRGGAMEDPFSEGQPQPPRKIQKEAPRTTGGGLSSS